MIYSYARNMMRMMTPPQVFMRRAMAMAMVMVVVMARVTIWKMSRARRMVMRMARCGDKELMVAMPMTMAMVVNPGGEALCDAW